MNQEPVKQEPIRQVSAIIRKIRETTKVAMCFERSR
jgi:hypothetical protein